jgi:hypothetical protein
MHAHKEKIILLMLCKTPTQKSYNRLNIFLICIIGITFSPSLSHILIISQILIIRSYTWDMSNFYRHDKISKVYSQPLYIYYHDLDIVVQNGQWLIIVIMFHIYWNIQNQKLSRLLTFKGYWAGRTMYCCIAVTIGNMTNSTSNSFEEQETYVLLKFCHKNLWSRLCPHIQVNGEKITSIYNTSGSMTQY